MCTNLRKDAVDLWDLTRLLIRRWYFAVPVLLLTLAGVLVASQTVRPDYSAKGHLQLIPPAHINEPANAKDNRVHNPWLELGIQALGQAAILKVQDEKVLNQLLAGGFSENFTISIDYPTTFFSIEAIGSSPQQATGTVREIMRLLSEDVRAEQRQFGVADQDSVSTLALDEGDKVTVVTSKVKRVLIVAAGLGLLTTAASTIGMDALLRRRARRRAAAAAVATGPPADTEVMPVIPGQRVNGKSLESTVATTALPKIPGQIGKASVPTISGPARSAPATKVRTGKVFTSKAATQHEQAQHEQAQHEQAQREQAQREQRQHGQGEPDFPDFPTAIIATPLVGEHTEAIDPDRGAIVVEYHSGDEHGPDAGPDRDRDRDGGTPEKREAAAGDPVPAMSDATIVLPLSHGDWAAARDGRGERS
jgi:hypothetical protein